ncbi:MAG: hypothetical protein NZ843_00700 [Fimbriimonadales bacterium]|nr:hypothetical protein [Fimbriimonadales bacterium]
MKQIILSVSDEVYEACEQIAKRTGRPVELCVMEFLTRHSLYTKPEPTEEQIREANERLRAYFGIIDTGNPDSANNESIDADLVRVI